MINVKKTTIEHNSISDDFNALITKDLDALIITQAIKLPFNKSLDVKLRALAEVSKGSIIHKHLTTYPLSYALIHETNDKEKNSKILNNFFEEAKKANHINYSNILGKQALNEMDGVLQRLTQNRVSLLEMDKSSFPSYNIRSMQASTSYAIEIHCENSFISQLNKALASFLLNTTDLENALSFYTLLQPPEKGGELILFDKTWDELPVNAGNLDAETRHDESLFFKEQTNIPHKSICLNQGDMVVFRAAQRWHCIGAVEGTIPRITMGGFIGQARNNKNEFFCWS